MIKDYISLPSPALYSDPIPQRNLKELLAEESDLFTFCTQTSRPFLFKNIFEVLPTLKNWSPEFLKDKIGNKIVSVNTSKTGVFQEYHKEIPLDFKSYTDIVTSDGLHNGSKVYMGGQVINKDFPELIPEIKFDTLLPKEKIGSKYLWFGPGNNVTGLHYDASYNFFVQLYGSKRFLFSAPSNFKKLYPRSAFSNYPMVSDVNPLELDDKKFPKAKSVKYYDIKIDAGSALYIPPYWWHQVISRDLIISVNLYCDTPKFLPEYGSFHLFPTYIRTLLKDTILTNRS